MIPCPKCKNGNTRSIRSWGRASTGDRNKARLPEMVAGYRVRHCSDCLHRFKCYESYANDYTLQERLGLYEALVAVERLEMEFSDWISKSPELESYSNAVREAIEESINERIKNDSGVKPVKTRIQRYKHMKLDEYQIETSVTAVYPKLPQVSRPNSRSVGPLLYPALGLSSEAGELAGVVKKIVRDDECVITDESYAKLVKELGDCMWYVATIARELNIDLSQVAEINLNKLQSRKSRDQIQGSGDDR